MFHKSLIFVYLCKSSTDINLSSLVVCDKCHSVPGSLSIAVIDVFHNGFVLKKLLEVPLEVWSNPADQLWTYRGIIKHPYAHARVFWFRPHTLTQHIASPHGPVARTTANGLKYDATATIISSQRGHPRLATPSGGTGSKPQGSTRIR